MRRWGGPGDARAGEAASVPGYRMRIDRAGRWFMMGGLWARGRGRSSLAMRGAREGDAALRALAGRRAEVIATFGTTAAGAARPSSQVMPTATNEGDGRDPRYDGQQRRRKPIGNLPGRIGPRGGRCAAAECVGRSPAGVRHDRGLALLEAPPRPDDPLWSEDRRKWADSVRWRHVFQGVADVRDRADRADRAKLDRPVRTARRPGAAVGGGERPIAIPQVRDVAADPHYGNLQERDRRCDGEDDRSRRRCRRIVRS
jgi:hypothetical protein